MPIKSLFGGWAQPVEAKTAAYTVLPSDIGKLFTNRGAVGSVTFTLPSSAGVGNGWWCEFATVAAQAIVIASSPVDTLIADADATADTATSTATIGNHFKVICDGTGMFLVANPGTVSGGLSVRDVAIAT